MDGIHIRAVSKTYRFGRVRALDQVSLEVRPGESLGIIGPNGAGKTTLLGCLLGFLRPDAGTITIDGRAPDDRSIRAVTGYLPERLVLDRWMSGSRFLAYHHALLGMDAGGRAADVARGLERVGLEPSAGRMPIRRYSRGMLQRLGLAQALMGEPRYLFLDEPVSGVDPAGVMLFRRLLADARSRGATLIVNSHQLAEVERVCDRVAFVKGGRVESIETPRAAETVARVMRVRWAAATAPEVRSPERLRAAAQGAGATLVEPGAHAARFGVHDDDGASRLLQALIAAGVRVVEAAPEDSGLERLFTDAAGAAAPPQEPRT